MHRLDSRFFKPLDGCVYVPFTREELTQDFIDIAFSFKKKSIQGGKNYSVIFYGDKALGVLPKGAKVYVLGHGMNLSPDWTYRTAMMSFEEDYESHFYALKGIPFSDWAYAVRAGKQAVSISVIAERMKEDGLFKADSLIIKLYFCDLNTKASQIAERFKEHLEGAEHRYRIDYYLNQLLHAPSEESDVIHKMADDALTGEEKRASLTRDSLFFKPKEKEVISLLEGPKLSV
jgi:hypothetical protein